VSATSRASESLAHLALKRVALQWAIEQGFIIAATEISLPNRGVRMDVAAYRPQRIKKQKGNGMISCARFRRDAQAQKHFCCRPKNDLRKSVLRKNAPHHKHEP
jgi:hypothetical protein